MEGVFCAAYAPEVNSYSYLNNLYTSYSRETSDENFVICNPKYKKPLELDILFNSK
jgi:Fe-S cluster assembly iron-binding protein IscA